jgi:uncharacterized protein YggT (Ycf19 family)
MTYDEHDLAGWGLRFTRVLVWLVYAYVVLASTILTIAFFLLLFNASTAAAFTQWVYRSADRVMEPFRGIFPTAVGENGAVLDFAVLFAIIMYGILAAAVGALLAYLDRKTQEHRAALAWSQAQSARTAHEAPHER